MSLALPKGYLAIPISAEQQAATLRLCAVVRQEPDPIGGHLVTLRTTMDARVVLGCVTDSAGGVLQTLEIWVQDPSGLAQSLPACRLPGCPWAMSNAALDDRWKRHFLMLLAQSDPGSVIQTGWEGVHPLPVFLDLAAGAAVHPSDQQSHSPWRLCQDEAVLAKNGLPPYGSTLHRYLYVPAMGESSPLIPVTPDAPANDHTRPVDQLLPPEKNSKLVPLNPAAGLMLVRSFSKSPIDFESFVTLLGGGRWEGILHGRTALDLPGLPEAVSALGDTQAGGAAPAGGEGQPSDEGRMFLGRHGRWGRLVETLHLKLRLLADAVVAVAAVVSAQQRPMLNLRAESFRIRISEPSAGLPLLWTAKAVLADGGEAVALSLPGAASDVRCFFRGGAPGVSVYWPSAVGRTIQGRASVRIRRVLPESGGLTIVEGTLATQERMEIGRNDLVWLRLGLSAGGAAWAAPVDLYAAMESRTALAGDEWRFRTVGQRFEPQQRASLKAAEGVPMPDCHFELVPQLSTPCDLYSLAVLMVRTLLVNPQTTLPVAIDEVISLARAVAALAAPTAQGAPPASAQSDHGSSIVQRIRQVVGSDPRWIGSLGPHRLVCEDLTAAEAFDLVPAELWWDVLAMIVRMLPGIGPDSTCIDYSDVGLPGGGGSLGRVFDPTLADLHSLLLRTRSLIVIDWRFNREIHAVVRGLLKTPGTRAGG